jgi:hypothetical protein
MEKKLTLTSPVPLGAWMEGLIDPVVRRAARESDQLREEVARAEEAEELEPEAPRSEDPPRKNRP